MSHLYKHPLVKQSLTKTFKPVIGYQKIIFSELLMKFLYARHHFLLNEGCCTVL